MLCEICGKREASVHYTEIVNGEATEHNICIECANDMNLGEYTRAAAIFDGESQLGKLLTSLLGLAMDTEQEESGVDADNVICPVCNTSYADFVKNSRFGCADCYEVFRILMEDHIKTLQGSDTHCGKIPVHNEKSNIIINNCMDSNDNRDKSIKYESEEQSINDKIALLEIKLHEAVREEDYESAAFYRDEIKSLRMEETSDE